MTAALPRRPRRTLQRPRHVLKRLLAHTGDATLGGRWLGRRRFDPSGFEVGEEGSEDADGGEERAKVVDKIEAGEIDEFAEERRADAAHAKGEAEEQAGDGANSSGQEFLGVDEDGGKGGGQDQADDDAENAGPEKIGVGQQQSERQNAENGNPDDVFAADLVAHGAADDGAGGDGAEKNE